MSSATTPTTQTKPLVRLVGVEKKLGRQKVLRGVNLEIREGERMVIIGRSGGGKSVLLKHIIGLMKPTSGKVLVEGQDITGVTERKMAAIRLGMRRSGSTRNIWRSSQLES